MLEGPQPCRTRHSACSRTCRALLLDLVEARAVSRTFSRSRAVEALKAELDELQAFRAEYGLPLREHAGPAVLRVDTAIERKLLDMRQRVLALENSLEAGPDTPNTGSS